MLCIRRRIRRNGQTTTYTYDPLGNLTHVALPDGRGIDYVIDGMGRRVGKKVNGVLQKQWLYADNLRVVAELDGSGNVVSRFVWADGTGVSQQVARSVLARFGLRLPTVLERLRNLDPRRPLRAPAYVIQGGSMYRVVSDHLGTTRLLVNVTNGTLAERLDLDEWGRVANDTSPGFIPLGFASGVADPDTQIVRLGARDYDAVTGRWTTKDPIMTQGGLNLYGYVGGDPVNAVDISGTDPFSDFGNCVISVVQCVIECADAIAMSGGAECGNVCSSVMSSCPLPPPPPWGPSPPTPPPNPFAGCSDPADAGLPSCTGPERDMCKSNPDPGF